MDNGFCLQGPVLVPPAARIGVAGKEAASAGRYGAEGRGGAPPVGAWDAGGARSPRGKSMPAPVGIAGVDGGGRDAAWGRGVLRQWPTAAWRGCT